MIESFLFVVVLCVGVFLFAKHIDRLNERVQDGKWMARVGNRIGPCRVRNGWAYFEENGIHRVQDVKLLRKIV